ncbi:hypothetical protein PI125_g18231 [Phytophthora idaei]|nr:hypothetical protein PI125_g18231 [Phytophthora idaei]
MPGLSASELPNETLYAGDTLEYYCRAFISGDPRGRRFAVVTRVNDTDGVEYRIAVDTEETVPVDIMTKLLADRFGKPFTPAATKWRKIRTYKFSAGSFSVPALWKKRSRA